MNKSNKYLFTVVFKRKGEKSVECTITTWQDSCESAIKHIRNMFNDLGEIISCKRGIGHAIEE